MAGIDTTFLTNEFKTVLTDFQYMVGQNLSNNIPIFAVYISTIAKVLIQFAYAAQKLFHIQIYNPLYQDTSLYFASNQMFIKNTYISVGSFIEMGFSLTRLQDAIIYIEANYPTLTAYTTQLQEYYDRIQQVAGIIYPDFTNNIVCDPNRTLLEIRYNNGMTIFVGAN